MHEIVRSLAAWERHSPAMIAPLFHGVDWLAYEFGELKRVMKSLDCHDRRYLVQSLSVIARS
jgi:hypothetical protein